MTAPLPPPTSAAPFALALLSLDGVGRVSAHRVLERFPTLAALRATPREQVLLRLKGVPNADQTVATLVDDGAFRPALDRAEAEVEALRAKGIGVVAPGGAEGEPRPWPAALDALPRADRPVVLYTYGDAGALLRPALSVLARAPVEGGPFETAQAVARRAGGAGGLVVGAQSGVDLALQKVALGAGAAVVVVVEAGLARLRPSMRAGATAAVRAGGVLVSPFPMTHGPFDHDDRERALVQAALGRAALAVAPPAGSSEDRAAGWASASDRPVVLVPPAPPEAEWAATARPADDLDAVSEWVA